MELDRAVVLNDLHEREVMERLSRKYRKAEYSFFWNSARVGSESLFHWHRNIVDAESSPDGGFMDDRFQEMAHEYPDEYAVYGRLMELLGGRYGLVRAYVNAYTHGTEGAPHVDSRSVDDVTAVVYLNREWHRAWGGETVVFNRDEEESLTAALPRLGRTILFRSNVLHAARPVSKTCNDLRMVLVFKFRRLDNRIDRFTVKRPVLREFISRIGADKIPHSGAMLSDHLWGTYAILAGYGCDEEVCLAGLFHSVYGTVHFKQGPLTVGSTLGEELRTIIGSRASNLVYLFSILKRPQCWQTSVITDQYPNVYGTTTRIGDEDMRDLRLIEKANLEEQSYR